MCGYRPTRPPEPAERPAFSLVELVIVVVILAIIAAIAVPRFSNAIENAQAARVAADLRVIAGAIDEYYVTHGEWPENADQSAMPIGLAPFLATDVFANPRTIRDITYDYDGPPAHDPRIKLRSASLNWPRSDRRRIDAILDDGNLDTGQVRRITGERLLYYLSPR